jgi:hypothetical protein
MNAKTFLKLATAMLACCVVGLASAKLPAPPPVDPVKAEEAKQKAAEAAKKEAELLGKAQDRVAERYKKQQKGVASTAKK